MLEFSHDSDLFVFELLHVKVDKSCLGIALITLMTTMMMTTMMMTAKCFMAFVCELGSCNC